MNGWHFMLLCLVLSPLAAFVIGAGITLVRAWREMNDPSWWYEPREPGEWM